MARLCRNCHGVLAEYQRYFCSERCRQEFRRRGYKPRTDRNKQGITCRNCEGPLTGKQRKWCSEACRKQAARRKRKASALKQAASGNVRESGRKYGNLEGYLGRRRLARLTIEIEVVQTAPYLDRYDPIFHLRMGQMLRKYEELLESAMHREVFGHRVTVRVTR